MFGSRILFIMNTIMIAKSPVESCYIFQIDGSWLKEKPKILLTTLVPFANDQLLICNTLVSPAYRKISPWKTVDLIE
jgi:hypothetical protein